MNYLVTYTAYGIIDNELKSGVMRVKNAIDEIHAQVQLELYLQKSVRGFARLAVHNVELDEGKDMFDNLMDIIFNA